MSAKLNFRIPEPSPTVDISDDLTQTTRQSRSDEEHHTAVMLLEAVACLRELSDIVLRHERILTAKNSLELARLPRQSPERSTILPQPDQWTKKLEAFESPLSNSELDRTKHDALPVRKQLPASLSFLLSAVASVSGLALTYVLFLR